MRIPFKNLNQQQREFLRQELRATQDMNEFFAVLQKRFDLSACKPGSMVKETLVNQTISTVLPMLNPDAR